METIVRDPRIRTYLERVDRLYGQVTEWMRAIDPKAKLTRQPIDIEEIDIDEIREDLPLPEPIRYRAESLTIGRPGVRNVQLIPSGRWVLGTEGRVDFEGPFGSEKFFYIPEEQLEVAGPGDVPRHESSGWCWIGSRDYGKFHELDRDLFRRLLERVSR